MAISIKTAEDIAAMRIACRLAGEVLDYIEPFVKPGVTTAELDRLCHEYMVDVQGCSNGHSTSSHSAPCCHWGHFPVWRAE